jgi:hypothetical protein
MADERNSDRIALRNINHPGSVQRLDALRVAEVRRAYLTVLPDAAPGLTIAEAERRLIPLLPAGLFPDGVKAGWWAKAIQLDLEARGVIVREPVRPLRLHRLPEAQSFSPATP